MKAEKLCKFCGNNFIPRKKETIFCSKPCSNNSRRGIKAKKVGTSRTGYYQGIYCGSTYELAWVIYNLDHDIKFIRNKQGFPYEFEGKSHKYYPDFILEDGTYIEIKGWKRLNDQAKWDGFPHKLTIIDKEGMELYFLYCSAKFDISKYKLWQLYDNSKPQYKYICKVCKKEFETYTKRNEEKDIYCSQSCAGKGVLKVGGGNPTGKNGSKFRYKTENFCKICNKKITALSTHCSFCKCKDTKRKEVNITKDELKQALIEHCSYSELGRKFGVTYKVITRLVKNLGLKEYHNLKF